MQEGSCRSLFFNFSTIFFKCVLPLVQPTTSIPSRYYFKTSSAGPSSGTHSALAVCKISFPLALFILRRNGSSAFSCLAFTMMPSDQNDDGDWGSISYDSTCCTVIWDFLIAWTQAKRRSPAGNQELICHVLGHGSIQNANKNSLVVLWTPLGNLVVSNALIFLIFNFFPLNNSPWISPSLPSLQDTSSFSCPSGIQHSADILSEAAFPAQQVVWAQSHMCVQDRGVQRLHSVIQQLKSCLWYCKYESQKPI